MRFAIASGAENSVCSLPRLRGRVGVGATARANAHVIPPPYPSPASGGGDAAAPSITTSGIQRVTSFS